MAIINGDNQDNILQGTTENDRMNGRAGNDQLEGLEGNDRLTGGIGNDLLDGGDGFDTVVETRNADFRVSDFTLRTAVAQRVEEDNLFSIEKVILNGGDAGNTFRAANYTGQVRFNGKGGNDDIEGGRGNDTLLGGNGNDTLRALEGDDRIIGGAGNDTIFVSGQIDNDDIRGGQGVDSVSVELIDGPRQVTISDTQLIGDGITSLNSIEKVKIVSTSINPGRRIDASAFSGNTEIAGFDNNDTITGGSGQDILEGNGGRDRLVTRDGINRDVLDGGDGNDTLVISQGGHDLIGGSGTDTIQNDVLAVEDAIDIVLTNTQLDFNGQVSSLTSIERGSFGGLQGDDFFNTVEFSGDVNINGNRGNDFIDAGGGDDALLGSFGKDTIFAGAGDDFVSGGNENDLISGDTGNDLVVGGAGDDAIFGGDGDDTLIGGNQFGTGTVGTVDQLFGGAGDDLFVLGDNRGDAPTVFYDDGDPLSRGGGDVAIIRDISLADDKIQLLGEASNYTSEVIEFGDVLGSAIFHIDSTPGAAPELIAVVDSVGAFDFNSDTFVFVPDFVV